MFGKKREPSDYEIQRERIFKEIALYKPGTDEYKKLIDQLTELRKFAGDEKEMKQRLDKETKKNIISKVVGFLGIGGLAFGLAKFEKDGNMFSGSSGEAKTGLLKLAFKLFG